MNDKVLFIFVDESGNFDFSPGGTKYFILTGIATIVPLEKREEFLKLRYRLLSSSVDKEYFHATEDEQSVRDQVFTLIKSLKDFYIDAVIAQKNKANPSLYQETDFKKGKIKNKIVGAEFYRIICQTLLQYIFRRYEFSKVNQLIVIMDACFTESKRNLILKSLKTYLKRNFNKPFEIYFHQSKADINCQIADYCGWAIYIKHDRNELRPLSEVKTKIKSEFQIFKSGLIEYYQYK